MSEEELTKLEEALKAKDENTVTDITISHTNAERVKIRDDYKSKFNRELFDDFEKYLKSDLKDTLVEIRREINNNYSEMFKKCNYQEDIEIYIPKASDYFNSIFPEIKEKYFSSLSDKRFIEVKENVEAICNEEYNKKIENKLPIW